MEGLVASADLLASFLGMASAVHRKGKKMKTVAVSKNPFIKIFRAKSDFEWNWCFIGLNRECWVFLSMMKHDPNQLESSYLVHLSPHVISQQRWTPGNILLLRTPKLK